MKQINETTTGHAHVNYLKEFTKTDYTLRAHAELPNYDFPLFEGRLSSLKSFKQFSLTCPSLQNKNSSLIEGILTFDKRSGGMKMKKWNKNAISKLKSLSNIQLTDRDIAVKLNQLDNHYSFTAMAVKRKRHRLNLLKKRNSVINKSTFYVKLQNKRGLGFTPAYMPLEFIKRRVPIKHRQVQIAEIERRFLEIAKAFKPQKMTWAEAYTYEDMCSLLGRSLKEKIRPEILAKESGYIYDRGTGLFYRSKEHYKKLKE